MSVRLREFRVSLGDDDLKTCEAAGIDPQTFVDEALANALAGLRSQAAVEEDAEEDTTEEVTDDEDGF